MTRETVAHRARGGALGSITGRRAVAGHLLAGAALAMMAMIVAPRPATAAPKVSCDVLEIEASSGPKPSVDPDLRALQKKLSKPPFSSWNVFKRLGSYQLALEAMKAGHLKLIHGEAEIILRDVTGAGGKKARVSLGITLDDASGKRVLDSKVAVDAGDYIVVGRSLKGNKGHLVALSCKP